MQAKMRMKEKPLPNTQPRHINDILSDIAAGFTAETISIGEVIHIMHERGFGMIIFLFALPMALPLPVPPGVNLLFSVPLLFLTAQMIYGAHQPWLPSFIRKKTLSKKAFDKFFRHAAPLLNKLSLLIRPRLGFVTQGWISNMIGIFGFLFALCICIPIPMTNTVPSFAILLMAIGLLMRDGLAILTGMLIGSGWILLLVTLGIAGLKALMSLIF
jgi:hypothetical protein